MQVLGQLQWCQHCELLLHMWVVTMDPMSSLKKHDSSVKNADPQQFHQDQNKDLALSWLQHWVGVGELPEW